MGVYFDNQKQLVHTVSKDKRYKILDHRTLNAIASNKLITLHKAFEPSPY
jgi:hypothetical protein